jgi:hypothetical protein
MVQEDWDDKWRLVNVGFPARLSYGQSLGVLAVWCCDSREAKLERWRAIQLRILFCDQLGGFDVEFCGR